MSPVCSFYILVDARVLKALAQISTSSRAQVYLIPRSCLSCNMWYHIRATYGVALCPLHPDPVELISIVTECTI